jgi:hypothetical protein
METFPPDNLAEIFEVDRSVMVKATRNVPPDLVRKGNRATWKIGTAAKALEVHRRKGDNRPLLNSN